MKFIEIIKRRRFDFFTCIYSQNRSLYRFITILDLSPENVIPNITAQKNLEYGEYHLSYKKSGSNGSLLP